MPYFGENLLHEVDLDAKTHNINPYPKGFLKSTVPAGQSGNWVVKKVHLTDANVGLDNLRLIRDGRPDRVVPPGDYTNLLHWDGKWSCVMSDTPAEGHEHTAALKAARGSVLINGLGLGFYLSAVLNKTSVKEVWVVEQSMDVIRLVAPTFLGYEVPNDENAGPIFIRGSDSQLIIIHADALSWRPPKQKKFDYVWHDIWTNIPFADDPEVAEMKKLKRAYASRTKAQGCWAEQYL